MDTGRQLYCVKCNAGVPGLNDPTCPTCGKVRPADGWPSDPRLGAMVVGGQYRVVRRLGSGGFGVVYEVETALGGLRRAMKVLKQGWSDDGDISTRFVNEATILDRLSHPNIARCYTVGRLDDTREPYILMELVEGESIASLVWPRGAKEPRLVAPVLAARIGAQIASALTAAHQASLLHRDLKPENVLLCGGDQVVP